MAKRSKRLRRQIESLERQINKHKLKILKELGKKDTTHNYWQKEILTKFSPAIERRKYFLKNIKKKR